MTKLGVNIDHVATLRQARKEGIPNLLKAAVEVKKGGADNLTVHLREDRRHIQDDDVYLLKRENILPINLEMADTPRIVQIALEVKPESVCLVPEKREELTTEGGLDVKNNLDSLKSTVDSLKKSGIEVSMFIDPDSQQIEASREAGADSVELHTGSYANAVKKDRDILFNEIKKGAGLAYEKNLKVNAGHGLNYKNVKPVAGIDIISDLNIGYSIVCRSVFTGLKKAVREMKNLIK
ncbi:MAG: pyridoxine 5'-phosphate synthase [Elusimicrobiota bacterium]